MIAGSTTPIDAATKILSLVVEMQKKSEVMISTAHQRIYILNVPAFRDKQSDSYKRINELNVKAKELALVWVTPTVLINTGFMGGYDYSESKYLSRHEVMAKRREGIIPKEK